MMVWKENIPMYCRSYIFIYFRSISLRYGVLFYKQLFCEDPQSDTTLVDIFSDKLKLNHSIYMYYAVS